ncbi:preprotein translocase subunit SecY [Candidatus Micrarchaeota archaeon]|nr:preprotein translocase subunit SecY [Candidatus Micrarchaeota archaeon]
MGFIKNSLISIIHLLPEIKQPDRPPNTKERIKWVIGGLLIYFIMFNTPAVGSNIATTGSMEFLSIVTASRFGTLLTVGIGPIVMASIFLQLFNGAGIIKFNMEDPEERKLFFGVQKLLAIILAFFEAYMFVAFGRVPVNEGMMVPVIIQVAFGSIILLYLDEIISKYGIGSGISLFIAAGVSFSVIMGLIGLVIGDGGITSILAAGGSGALTDALIKLTPLYFTILVFIVVVYAEGMKIEIPLAFDMARGAAGRLPIKFLYVSNIPVILTAALMMNITLFATMLPAQTPGVQPSGPLSYLAVVEQSSTGTPQLRDGLLYFIMPIRPPRGVNFFSFIRSISGMSTPYSHIPELVHMLVYSIVYIIFCVIFGMFWVETANMGPKAVAEQLMGSGLMIPGHRRDPRMIERILNKYLPVVVILGSAFVGLLAVLADLTGALGTGTGILLTVTILNRFYEQLMSMRVFSMYPAFGKIFGMK